MTKTKVVLNKLDYLGFYILNLKNIEMKMSKNEKKCCIMNDGLDVGGW